MKSNVSDLEKRLYRKRGMMRAIMNRMVIIVSGLLIVPLVMFGAGGKMKPVTGPTEANALAADQELARAMRDNDTTGIMRMLDKSWAVIATTGGIGEGPSIFPSGIKSGYLVRKTYSISEPRVRLYGDMAVVTTKVQLSGTFQDKPFEVEERQTDVWYWKDGGWKCVLTHETKLSK
jgi:ketosteroid isomerase-like protein